MRSLFGPRGHFVSPAPPHQIAQNTLICTHVPVLLQPAGGGDNPALEGAREEVLWFRVPFR